MRMAIKIKTKIKQFYGFDRVFIFIGMEEL